MERNNGRRWVYFLAIVLMAIQMSVNAFAAPALRGVFTVRQPDGTLLSVEQYGDEYHHWTATNDGVYVINRNGAYYVAAIDESGNLSSTGILAHALPLRDNRERQLIALQSSRLSLFHQRWNSAVPRSLEIHSDGKYFPHQGSPRVLTILVAFQDCAFTVNNLEEAFYQYFNGDTQQDFGNKNHYNLASVRQYFDICSRGQFTPQFDIVGPVTLPNEMDYYGADTNGGRDKRFSTFCRDAVTQAKDLVADWSVYDNDGDGAVEMVCIIYAGYGQNQGGGEETIWAKASRLDMNISGVPKISFFNCSPEHFYPSSSVDEEGIAIKDYINGTGVFIHEMSHCMGLPDLYQTDGNYANNQGMEAWDVMDYGLYTRNGFAPASYTAWEQEVMGWTELEPLTAPQHLSELLPLIEGGRAYKIENTSNDNEFIVMEPIMKRGLNSYALGSGLLVYHVDYPYPSIAMYDHPNNTVGRPAVAVVPASGLFINVSLCGSDKEYTKDQWRASMAGALFPGIDNVTTLTPEMNLPNYLFYDDSDTAISVGFDLYDISLSDDGVSFQIRTSDPDGILPVLPSTSESSYDCYDLLGRKLGNGALHGGKLYIDRKTRRIFFK